MPSVNKDRQALVQKLTEMWGTLDILVNNAGTNTRKKTLENTEEQYSSLIDLNMKSVFELCRMFHPLLKNSGDASIVNIVSVAGITSVGTGSPYAIFQSRNNSLYKIPGCRMGRGLIRVNAVAPWYIRTSLTEPVLKDPGYLSCVRQNSDEKNW